MSVRVPFYSFKPREVQSFNTTLVSVRGERSFFIYCKYSKFQYNACVGSSKSAAYILSIVECFNTTLVSVRVGEKDNAKATARFQYNACVGSSRLEI